MLNPYEPQTRSREPRTDEPVHDPLWLYALGCIATTAVTTSLVLVAIVSLGKNVDRLVFAVAAILCGLLVLCVLALIYRKPAIAVSTLAPLSVAWLVTMTGGGPPSTLKGFLFTLPLLVPYIGHKIREPRRVVHHE
jgi:hypothetical protein